MTHQNIDYIALLHERGFRVTAQRQIILDAICEGDGHTTPDEIFARVRARFPSVNRTTVYRNLVFLCDMRLVIAAEIGRGHKVYEIAGETPHHHLVCRTCGQIQQIGHAAVESLITRIEREHGFAIDTDHLALFGLCPTCRERQAARAN